MLRPVPTEKVTCSSHGEWLGQICTCSVTFLAAAAHSHSTISLQFNECERAGGRSAGEDTTNQSQHHYRLLQQGPVGPAHTHTQARQDMWTITPIRTCLMSTNLCIFFLLSVLHSFFGCLDPVTVEAVDNLNVY